MMKNKGVGSRLQGSFGSCYKAQKVIGSSSKMELLAVLGFLAGSLELLIVTQ
jgi:hypothetical protein